MSKVIDGLYRVGEDIADTKAPHDVPIEKRWEQRKFLAKLVNPANRRKLDIIVVGSGLAGGAAAASGGRGGAVGRWCRHTVSLTGGCGRTAPVPGPGRQTPARCRPRR